MTHALAQERLPSQPPSGQLHTTPTMLALDLGTTTGWALRAPDGLITSGTVSFRPSRYDGGGMRYLRFTNWLTELDRLSGPIAAIWYEEVRRHAGTDASHIYGGLMATLTAWAELRGVPYQGTPVGTIKRHATGKGNAPKAAMIAAARARGFSPADDNEADAIAILLWAIDTRRRCAMSARQILEHTADVVDQRREAYGPPDAIMAAIAARWSLTLGRPVTPAQVTLCMIDLKLARLCHDPEYRDGVIDVIGYAALLPEVLA